MNGWQQLRPVEGRRKKGPRHFLLLSIHLSVSSLALRVYTISRKTSFSFPPVPSLFSYTADSMTSDQGSSRPPSLYAPCALVDCVHPSTFARLAADKARNALYILQRIFGNLLAHPTEVKYHSLRTDGTRWQSHIQPLFYPLRLYEWMGFELSSDGAHLTASSPLLAEEGGAAATRLAEVQATLEAWTETTAPPPQAAALAKGEEDEAELENTLLTLSDTVPRDEDWARWKQRLRCALVCVRWSSQQQQQQSVSAPAAHGVSEKGNSESNRAAISLPSPLLQSELQAIEATAPAVVAWLRRCTTTTSSRLTLPALEEALGVVDSKRMDRTAAAMAAASASSSSPGTTSTAASEAKQRIAERHRQQLSLDSLREREQSTGAAFRTLSMEEQLTGVRLIADIAGFMEQVALVTETQGMVRQDRLEAQRLLTQFRQDGDLLRLHALREEWEDRLEEAKKTSGKQMVFL